MIFILSNFIFWNFLLFILFALLVYIARKRLESHTKSHRSNTITISFLHPFCNDCGGGERVLWTMVKALNDIQNTEKHIHINILSGTNEDASVILKNINNRFNLHFKQNKFKIQLIRLKTANLLKPNQSFATMLLQIIGQIIFGFEIITCVYSDYVIDTTGFSYCFIPIRLLGGSRIISYVHYPFISFEMLDEVKNDISGVHSRGKFSRYRIFKFFKILYYKLILFSYSLTGKFCEYAYYNSSWTKNHMVQLWTNVPYMLLYPPCSVEYGNSNNDDELFSNFSGSDSSKYREHAIVSFAQFRPEKNQKMQIDILNKIIKSFPEVKLNMIGSIRHEDDQIIFNNLQNYAKELNLSDKVTFFVNKSHGEIQDVLKRSYIGIHTMKNEHFGITIIEMMASGLITIAHKSAGPLNDIIGPMSKPVGFLAAEEDDYVDLIRGVLKNNEKFNEEIRSNAKSWIRKFSTEAFIDQFIESVRERIFK